MKTDNSQKNIKQQIFRILEKSSKPFNYKQIAKKIKFADKKLVLQILENLIQQQKIEVTEKYKFFIKKRPEKILNGYIEIIKKLIFFRPEESDELIALSSNKKQFFFNNDYVTACVINNKGACKAKVLSIIKRHKNQFVGIVEKLKSHCFVVPSDKHIKTDFYISTKNDLRAKNKDKVIVEIIDWPQKAKSPFGKIIKILGNEENVEAAREAILHKYDIKPNFKESTIFELKKINDIVSVKEKKSRKDLRNVNTFTIDPDDAKDFDDAISIKKINDNIYEIGVHIADVTYYIKEGSSLDKEAYERGCSVYLENSVIPMIPEKLSNQICSLRPKEDKLCFSVIFKVSKMGKIIESWIGKTIINSDYRFTYQEAQNIINGAEHELKKEIILLHNLSQKFRTKRIQNGSVMIKQEEIKVMFDESNLPTGAKTKKVLFSNQLVEEFMLLANQEVCKYYQKNKPNVFRVHDGPDLEKLKSLVFILRKLDMKLDTSAKNLSKEINNLLTNVKGKENESLINQLILRCMSKAKYSTENIGHFGLAFKKYTHFTSPIRRYPDMLVHRELINALNKGEFHIDLEKKCIHNSKKEKNAIQAEREYRNYVLLWMIRKKENEVCEAVISSVKEWGAYVRLNEYLCEGLIHISKLKKLGAFYFDNKKEAMVNKKTGNHLSLGDSVTVKIERINLNHGELDLSIESI